MISVGIVGGTGYTGVELLRILLRHPEVTVTTLTSRTEAGKPIANLFPSLRGQTELTFSDLDIEELKQCDVVFFATPHGVAMKHAEALVAVNTKVIDLAADFRIQNLDVFEKWYGLKHTCPELLQQSVYGLSELRREQIKHASVVGNPGCYPTTVQLGLAPLLQQAGLIVPERILIDAKSGVSGAGRKAELSLVYSENADNFKAYGVAGHRHHPEIVEALGVIAADTTASFDNIIFVPHLVPMIRGMLSTIYVDLTDKGAALDIQALYEMFYADEYFVDVMPQGSVPDTRSVRGSNMLRMSLTKIQPNKLVIVVVQDNLMKGAAGQAVQNMNIMCGLSENLGLTGIALLP